MNLLKEFTAYIKREQIQYAIARQRELYASIKPNLTTDLSKEFDSQLDCFIEQHFLLVLDLIEKDNDSQSIKHQVDVAQVSQLSGTLEFSIKASDLIEVFSMQKMLLTELMPFFTDHIAVACKLSAELQKFYKKYLIRILQGFERKQYESQIELRESEERYKDIFDNAHDLIHIVAPDGTIIYVNNAWIKTLGYSLGEIQGESIYSFVDAADKERFIKHRQKVLENTNEYEEITIGLKGKSGRKIFVEGLISPKIKKGKPVYTRAIFRDITSRIEQDEQLRLFNEQLKEREDHLQQLIDHAPDAIIVIDSNSNISLWNPKAEEIFGWRADEVVGKKLSEKIIPPAYREAHDKGMKRYLSTGEAHVLNKTIEITAINKKREEFHISLTISKLKLKNDLAFISFIRDISLQKKNEIELEQYSRLTSHDLSEPLRKILIYSDIILNKKDLLPSEIEKYISKIHESGSRMSSLIKAILMYSSLVEEKSIFEKTDLNQLIKEVLNDLELLIEDNNAVIAVNQLPIIEVVPFQMRQLFQNLISNAIKYRKKDIQPVIQITSNKIDKNMIQFLIKDNGIGFDTKHKEKVFGLFQRLSTAQKIEGSGVGLAICKKIVEKHSGIITVESMPEVGTTFIVTLPLTQ